MLKYNNLTSVTIPSSVTSIGNYAFYACSVLTRIDVDSDNNTYSSMDGVLFNKSKTSLIQYPIGRTALSYNVPDGVKEIESRAFASCKLQIIAFPKSLTDVEATAFNSAKDLLDVLYAGTMKEYGYIYGISFNDALYDANVTYNYNGAPAAIHSALCLYDKGKITAKIQFDYLMQDSFLAVAVYNQRKLVTLKTLPVTPSDLNYSFEFDADESYKGYEVKAFCWESARSLKPLSKADETVITEAEIINEVLESAHPYENNTDETKIYTYDGVCESIDVTFSKDTYLDWSDYIYIYDANDALIGKYTKRMLAGVTVHIPGNTVKIRLTSDRSYNEYGFRTESIVVNK